MNAFYYANAVCSFMGGVALLSAIAVISLGNKNPVNAVLWLIVAFVAVACYLITAGMTFIGLSYVIVYVGAIAVLFLFVVMMLNIATGVPGDRNEAGANTPVNAKGSNTWPLAVILISISLAIVMPLSQTVDFDIPLSAISLMNELWYSAYTAYEGVQGQDLLNADTSSSAQFYYASKAPMADALHYQPSGMNQVQALGMTLYTHGALWLLLISILLMLAILVPLALAFTV